MFDISLPLFPFDSTAITVTTTVWVGVMVSVFFNLRLGWTLSGLVVPGFIVPLIVTRPITACVILLEAILTYWIVYALSESPRKTSYWSSFFGRDRFFVILLVSVLVRAVMDAFLLPWIGRIAVEEYAFNFDYRNNLHSFGLIMVALIANYFWKPGVMRGLPPLATCVGITFVLVQGLLVKFTNFNVGNFHLMYEDVTTSLLASPKAYIIILTTAYLASWMNLRYAWDFNGILIPALLGLLWHDPVKILVSGAECFVLVYLGSRLMKTFLFRKIAIEGSRKVAYFFSICFCYRLIACHVIPVVVPSMNMTDVFGLGYLLTTLMAIKINDKKKPISMLLGTTKVSILGAVAGSIVGFALLCGPRIDLGFAAAVLNRSSYTMAEEADRIARSVPTVVRQDKTLLYEKRQSESYQRPLPNELSAFRSSLEMIRDAGADLTPELLMAVSRKLHRINYRVSIIQDRYVYLRERSPANGWGIYVIDSQQADGVCIQVPAPLDEWSTLESGLSLLKHLPSSCLAIAGTPRRVNLNGEADVTNAPVSMYSVFHNTFGKNGVVQVRGYTRSSYRRICEAEEIEHDSANMRTAQSRIYIRGQVPEQINLADLKRISGSLDVRWNSSPVPNRFRDDAKTNFAELILNRIDRRRLVGQLAVEDGVRIPNHELRIAQVGLREWLGNQKSRILEQGSNQYVPAKLEAMLYMDQEVITPLIDRLSKMTAADLTEHLQWQDSQIGGELSMINEAALAQGYELTMIQDLDAQDLFVAVAEVASEQPKGWGTFVFRVGLQDPFAVEIPRPLFERRSFDFGVNLFERPRGSALLVAGAHPRANADGASDISKTANKTNLFNLVRHVLLRRLGDRPFLITQARAIQAPVQADIVIATDDGATIAENLSPLKSQLLDQLQDDRLSVAFVSGQKQTAGYELGILMQATSVQVSQNKEVVSLWLSPSLRNKYREQSENHTLTAQFEACGISTVNEKLTTYLSQFTQIGQPCIGDELDDSLRSDLLHYLSNYDVVRLHCISKNHPNWSFQRLVDPATGQAFLAISRSENRFPIVLNLTGAIGEHTMQVDRFEVQSILNYVRSRSLWLEPGYDSQPAEPLVEEIR